MNKLQMHAQVGKYGDWFSSSKRSLKILFQYVKEEVWSHFVPAIVQIFLRT